MFSAQVWVSFATFNRVQVASLTFPTCSARCAPVGFSTVSVGMKIAPLDRYWPSRVKVLPNWQSAVSYVRRQHTISSLLHILLFVY